LLAHLLAKCSWWLVEAEVGVLVVEAGEVVLEVFAQAHLYLLFLVNLIPSQ
jgi:hypothetical protein